MVSTVGMVRGRLRHQWFLRVYARTVHQAWHGHLLVSRSRATRINSDGRTSAERVLGGTDPKTACATSLRHAVFKGWKGLGLAAEPNTENNGVHASASPFEALAERANWLGMPFGVRQLRSSDAGHRSATLTTIKAWCDDPAVPHQNKAQSLFDLVEDLDSRDCLRKSASISARFANWALVEEESLDWPNACGRRDAGGDLVQHPSVCDAEGRRFAQVSGCARGVHG